MAESDRLALIRKIEDLRKSRVVCYLTSLRPGINAPIADDAVRVFFDHLQSLPASSHKKIKKLDLYLCSNGGAGTVPWRLVSLFREYAESFNVLIPYRAYSAATLISLGADEIVMHPFAELGPIDPKVMNEFNPKIEGTTTPAAISVEDVKSYVLFIKSTVGITHEDELVQAIKSLTDRVHPLALGNVERFLSQSRMVAKKILRTHMGTSNEHIIDEIVENLASKLYFHGHPINRREAKEELQMKVAEGPPSELEEAMWELYLCYEKEFENRDMFNPAADLMSEFYRKRTSQQPTFAPVQVPQQPGMAPQPGLAGAVAIQMPQVTFPEREYELLSACIESQALTSRHTTKVLCQLVPQMGPGAVAQSVLEQGWRESQRSTAPQKNQSAS